MEPKRTVPPRTPAGKTITPEAALKQLEDAGRVIHLAHRSALDFAGEISAARSVRRQREALRVTARYGEDSQQAKAANARIARQASFDSALSFEKARAAVPVPPADPEAAVLYGRVLESTGKPVDCAVVQVASGNKTVIATARSDASGAYELRAAERPAGEVRLGAARSAGQPFHDFGPLPLALGSRAYRDIVFPPDKDQPPCEGDEPPPPPGPVKRTVRVPDVTGMKVDEAAAHLTNAGLGVTDPKSRRRGGVVTGQKPAAGAKVKPGRSVALTLGSTRKSG